MLIFILLCITSSFGSPVTSSFLNLTILHNNDVHSRFAPTNIHCGPCYDHPSNCYGGMARTKYLVDSIKSTSADPRNVLFLNAGDFYQGTIWYTLFKHQVVTDFVNLLKFDAITLGNHEFDDGVNGLYPFIDAVNTSIICANIDFTREPLLRGKVDRSMVIERSGVKIGIIGFVIRDTEFLSSPGKTLTFLDEIDSIKQEVITLKKMAIKILIGLSHAGYSLDVKIAQAVPELDIIVGGHTNTFLYTPLDDVPSIEKATDTYPKVIKHGDGRETLIVQAYAYGKYLGRLDVSFDGITGDLLKYSGNPILVDSSIPEDPTVKSLVDAYHLNISDMYSEVLGESKVVLDSEICRMGECLFGNLLTDMMVDHFSTITSGKLLKDNKNNKAKNGWTDFPIALLNSGILRSTINSGIVRLEDVVSVFPFNNQFNAVHMSGDKLFQTLEHSVSGYDANGFRFGGKFLQVSGLKVVYDLSKAVGSRIVSVRVRCGNCSIPEFEPIVVDRMYSVLVSDYILNGGDGYGDAMRGLHAENFNQLDIDVLKKYMKLWSPVFSQKEERIVFLKSSLENGKSCPH